MIKNSQSGMKRIILRWSIRETMGIVLLAMGLFLPAGSWDWAWGWVLVAITALWVIATASVLIPRNPELLADRLGPKKGSKRWDMMILSLYGLIMLIRCVVAGFDHRFGWTQGISLSMQMIALLITIFGYILLVWATSANAFFAQTVRIQTERSHSVASDGPYRYVRHPGYVGTILSELFIPLMLGSWWAFIPGVVIAVLFILRTALEDRTLKDELPDYRDYAQRVHFRLVPGLW